MTEGEQGTDGKFPNQPSEQEAASSYPGRDESRDHVTLESHRGVWGPRWLLDLKTFNVTLEK